MNMFQPVSRTGEPDSPAAAPAFSERPLWQRATLIALPVALVGGVVGLLNREAPAAAAPPPPLVTVAPPLVREITEWDDYTGRFEASKSVEVRPRVSGAVTAIHFADGAIVRKGQLLFTIDPRP